MLRERFGFAGIWRYYIYVVSGCVPYVVASVPVSTTCTLSPRRCVQIEMRGVRLTSWRRDALLQVWEIYNHLPSYVV